MGFDRVLIGIALLEKIWRFFVELLVLFFLLSAWALRAHPTWLKQFNLLGAYHLPIRYSQHDYVEFCSCP